MSSNLLVVENLTVTVAGKNIVSAASLEVPALSVTALVGGSGSGKTTMGLAILRLLPLGLVVSQGRILFYFAEYPAVRCADRLPSGGDEGESGVFERSRVGYPASKNEPSRSSSEIPRGLLRGGSFIGKDVLKLPEERMRLLRGKDISMVFQEPLYAFNPVFSIGDQIEEVLRAHSALNARPRRERILELLNLVGLPDPERIAGNYPHQLSGGMRQRAMIAQAIAAGPKLIIADEPTSNLDVTLQANIMELFRKLKDELKLSILLITHDLGMVAHMADHVAVMTEGKIVERGTTREVLENPKHPYTRTLMEALEV